MTPEDEEFEALERRLNPKTTQPSQGWRKRQIEALKPREWVSLTDDEIDTASWVHFPHSIQPSFRLVFRHLEQQLKEKNHYT